MKSIILVSLLALAGCTMTKINGVNWEMQRISFLQSPEIQGVTIAPDGSAELKGYKNGDNISQAIGEAVGVAIKTATQ